MGLFSERSAVYAVPMCSSIRWWPIVLAVAVALLAGACRRGPAPRITLQDVERCERGIDLAASQATLQEATSTFYRECSDTCVEPACREAFLDAAAALPDRQVSIVLARCSASYCPLFSEQKLTACDSAFVMNPFTDAFAWAELHDAILKRDASGYRLRLQRAFVAHGMTLAKLSPGVPPTRAVAPAATPALSASAAAEATDAGASPCAGVRGP
jgi:hypothetical protein